MERKITIHEIGNMKIAEVARGATTIYSSEQMLDLMADISYNSECNSFIIHEETLDNNFFDLKTKIAGDILQKISNYRMKLAVIGDFSKYKSKSLKDFIMESNKHGHVIFVSSVIDALERLGKAKNQQTKM
jgi:predicted nicotinamide N-methyase